MPKDATLKEQLIERIETALNLCDSVDTPTVCGMLGDPEAKGKLVELIMKKVIQQKLDISEAIIAIDNEFNPNSID